MKNNFSETKLVRRVFYNLIYNFADLFNTWFNKRSNLDV